MTDTKKSEPPPGTEHKNLGKGPAHIYSSLAFVLTFLIVGLPLWWKTTAVYRVSLPYNEIEALNRQQIVHAINVSVLLVDSHHAAEDLAASLARQSDLQNMEFIGENKFSYAWTVTNASRDDKVSLLSAKTAKDLTIACGGITLPSSHITVIILPKGTLKGAPATSQNKAVCLEDTTDAASLHRHVVSYVRKDAIKEHILKRVYLSPGSLGRTMPEKERMRPLNSAPEFDVKFTLVVPEPQLLDVNWDIENAVNAYMDPFLDKLSPLVKVTVKSQVLFLISLGMHPKYDKAKGGYMLSPDKLPLLINPIEGHLGFHASINPVINFVVYVTPKAHHPLYIYDERGEKLETNAFLSPKWGGFLFYNVEAFPNGATVPTPIDIDMHQVFEVFLAQLRLLIGLPDPTSRDGGVFVAGPTCTDLEVDFLLRRRTQDYLSASVSSLFSLSQLLSTISNIVITDEIGDLIYSSVDAATKSLADLKNGDLISAFKAAEAAFVKSEKAFFDPSLLALLYFPDDQKYAIYIPLFLPVSIPVLLSIRHLCSYYYKRQPEKTLKTD